MFTLTRAALTAALVALTLFPAAAADKPFERSDLDDAAIRLEAQIKHDAGPVLQSLDALRQQANAAFQKHDYRTGMLVLGKMIAAAPDNAATWLRLARTVRNIVPRDNREKALLLDRASTAAYIAYRRAKATDVEADSLALLGQILAARQLWRPALDAMRLALKSRETASLRAQYEHLRLEHGFRLLDYSVDSDAISPRACFQFSEKLKPHTDISPFVAVKGQSQPALSTADQQLCVEGLKHGERYDITLRTGLPSTVHEALTKSAEFTIFVRDRKPFVRFSGKAYVLPRDGQRGIPVLSVNTSKVKITIYHIGDRNLLDTVLGHDFQRNLSLYQAQQLADQSGVKVWSGTLSVDEKLNTEVTTAFPVEKALGALKPGVYVMTAKPANLIGNNDGALATQWFIVSDLGLTAYSSPGGIDVFVHSLASAAPLKDVKIQLLARDNEELASGKTDGNGFLHYAAGLTRGEGGLASAALIASDKGDYSFLSLKSPPFDLSDRGVGGRLAPAGLDAFIYTERGVYRRSETVHVTALLRDRHGEATSGVPLTLIMERPDGVEYRRELLPDEGFGGHSWNVPIVASAMSGTWRVSAYTDPKRAPIGETTFLVEDYVPDRIEFNLTSSAKTIAPDSPAEVSVDGRFLYGAPASKLELDGSVNIVVTKERPGFPGYDFGLADDEVTATRQELTYLPDTDASGKASFAVKLGRISQTTRPLQAVINIGMAEPGGRAVERELTLPIKPAEAMIGVKPLFNGRSLPDDANADFDVIVAAPDGSTEAEKGLHYQLLKIETSYQWYRENGQWQFEPVKRTERVANGSLDVAAGKPAQLSLPVKWGRYRLEVSAGGPNGAMTSIYFDAGFYAGASTDTPNLLELALDKKDYKPGDTMAATVTARSAGRLTINVFTDRLVKSKSYEVKAGTVQTSLTVGKNWGTGAYVVATMRRPLNVPAGHMPERAIGVKWFSIDRSAHELPVTMHLPAIMRSNSTLSVPLHLAGLKPGEQARVVVAAVDVGILNLTNYKPPAPDDYYLGQRRLSADIRDLYGDLIDGMQGALGPIRSGGGAEAQLTGSPPTQAPLAFYSGIIKVAADGSAQVNFGIPSFTGTVRVMAVAWSKDRLGKAVGAVVVRDPVVLTATLPRFLRNGDSGAMQLSLDNVNGSPGDYSIALQAEGPLKLVNDKHTLHLTNKQRAQMSVPVTAETVGAGTIDISISGPGGFTLTRAYALDVRPATQTLIRRTVRTLTPGETLSLNRDMFADFVPGTGRVALSVAIANSLDAATMLNALDRYPFHCSEQITSVAMAMLYIKDLGGKAPLGLSGDVYHRINDAIARLMSREDSNGSFGLWSVGGEDIWLDAYVTDFLTRARAHGFKVPAQGFTLALDRLRNYVGTSPDPGRNGGRDLAYALYVLTENGAAPIGDLRYLADIKLNDLATPIAKAQLGAALTMLDDKMRAARAFNAALEAIPAQPKLEGGRADFGSALRDSAALVTLAAESGAAPHIVDAAMTRVDAARALTQETSTQEDTWLVLAASALAKKLNAISLSVDGVKRQGALYRTLTAHDLAAPLTVANSGMGNVQAVVSVSGAPLTPEPAAERGFKIERHYFTLDGKPADPTHAAQNQRFVVVLKVTEPQPEYGRVMVADYLPAGFEIDNPRLVSSGDTGTLSWIKNSGAPVDAEFRDDRFAAAFDRDKNSSPVFTVAYVVRAVTPGHYVLPQASVQDMYRPDRFGRTGTGVITVQAEK